MQTSKQFQVYESAFKTYSDVWKKFKYAEKYKGAFGASAFTNSELNNEYR